MDQPHVGLFSRRKVMGGLVALTGGAAGFWVLSHPGIYPARARLQAALYNLPLPVAPGQLELVGFERVGAHITIAVQLTWTPGRRQQKFEAHHATEDQSVDALVQDVTTWVARLV